MKRLFCRYVNSFIEKLMSKASLISLVATLMTWVHAFSSNDTIRYEGEVHATVSAGQHTPFWLVNNLSGLGSIEKNNGYVRAAAFKDLDGSRRFSWGAGVDLVGAWRSQAPFRVHQLYGEVKYRCLDALVGSKEIKGMFRDSEISSGNLLYSGNAMPIPQIRLGIFDYASFWGTKGWLSVKGYVSFGMFSDSKWQRDWANPRLKHAEDVLYHSKGLWLRGGNREKFPLLAEVGIEMATQFGGKSYQNGVVIDMPSGLKDWLKAFFPYGGGNETPEEEQTNIQGNMLGCYDIALTWAPQADWSVKAYFEHYFDDQSQMTFEYGWKDGLWGVEIAFPKNPVVSSFVYEYLTTKDQTGAVYNDKTPDLPEQVSGRDNYYNHYLYNGWQHWGMGIGNPLIMSPIYNADHDTDFASNRVQAHHFGLAGNPLPELSWKTLFSFSRNWGSYYMPYDEIRNNFNFLAEVRWKPAKLNGWYFKAGVAADAGSLLGRSFGAMLTVGKTGLIKVL